MSKQSLSEAVNLAGGQNALAIGIKARFPNSKVSQAHIWKWLNRSACEVPPAEYVIAIADIVHWKMTPHQIRADIYPNPTDAMPSRIRDQKTFKAPDVEEPFPTGHECGSIDPRRGERRTPDKRQRVDRRADES